MIVRRLIVLILLLSVSGLYSNKLPNDIRWVVKSDEYSSLTEQIYNMAWVKIKKKIKKCKKENLAIIMDLDETVLDNSGYQLYLTEQGEQYTPATWDEWVVKQQAKLVPGAYDFIKKVQSKNIQLIYISNRMDARVEETKNNMESLGVLSEDDIFLLRIDKADKKTVRREEVYSQTGRMEGKSSYKIIAYFGDAMGDFPTNKTSNFGNEYFIFPNPMYGKW